MIAECCNQLGQLYADMCHPQLLQIHISIPRRGGENQDDNAFITTCLTMGFNVQSATGSARTLR